VKINGKYYDPSYGRTYNALAGIDDEIVAGFYAVPKRNAIQVNIRPNPVGRDLYELLSQYGYWRRGPRIPAN